MVLCPTWRIFGILLVPLVAAAASWTVEGLGTKDNSDLVQAKISAERMAECSPDLYWLLRAGGGSILASQLNGLPGGSRITGELSTAAIFSTGRFSWKLGAGWQGSDAGAWLARGEVKTVLPSLQGVSAILGLESRRLDEAWLSEGVRSNSAKLAVSLHRGNTWAECGGIWDRRSGGESSDTFVRFPDNRIATAYAWVSRSWNSWLMAGLSCKATRATADLHQMTEIVSDSARWTDVPYQNPLNETVFSGILRLRAGPVTFKADWPIYSVSKLRSDNVWGIDSGAYYYWAKGVAPANLELRYARTWPWNLELAAKLSSRPYSSYSWFRSGAWNQAEFDITIHP